MFFSSSLMQGALKSKDILHFILIWKHVWIIPACLAEIADWQ